MPKDDLGIEVDDELYAKLKDPKPEFSLLNKFLDYREKRKAAEAKIAEEQNKPKAESWLNPFA